MTPLRLMIGHEPDAHWQRLARFYQDFARDEGSIATLSANAIQAAVKRQNPGYRLAAIADHGFIAWSDHPNHPVDILDIFIKRTARGQGVRAACDRRLGSTIYGRSRHPSCCR